ncbi:MAG: hypothetical protein ACOY4K_06560 [Pseudomonadota bacterium]
MANTILAYGNQIDGATLSGGSWLASMPLTNLQDRRIGKIARSASPAAVHTKFDIDFSGTRLHRVIGLVGHNLTTAARYRLTLSSAADFSTIVHDSGWLDVWPTVYPSGTLPWGSPSWWTGKYSAEEIAAYTATIIYILETSTNARYIRVELDDEENPAGYVQLGRVFAGDGYQPVRNITYGASMTWVDPTEVQESLDGAESFNERRPYRVAKFGLDAMTEAEAMADAFELIRSMGISKEVIFIWDPDDTVHALRRQFLGRFRQLNPIENAGPNRWKAPFEVKELL